MFLHHFHLSGCTYIRVRVVYTAVSRDISNNETAAVDIKSISSFLRESFPSQLVAHILRICTTVYTRCYTVWLFEGFTKGQYFSFFSKVGPLFDNIGMPAGPVVYTHERVYSVRVYWPWGAHTIITPGNHRPLIHIPWSSWTL